MAGFADGVGGCLTIRYNPRGRAIPMITYHQLETFLTVVRAGGPTRAARELKASQPAVTLQMNAVRDFLGTPLYERAGGRFRLTPVGEKLRRYAEDVLGGLRVLQQDAAAIGGHLAGSLTIGATFVVSRYILPSTLCRFREEFPDVDLQLHVEYPEPLFGSLLSSGLDAACHLGAHIPAGLTVEPLCEEELVIVVSPHHPLAGRDRVRPRMLAAYPFVTFWSTPLKEMIAGKLAAVGITPRVAAEGKHHEAVKKLVERNVGYSLLVTPSVAEELASGRLVRLRFDGPRMVGQVVMTYRSGPAVPPLVRQFIDFVRADLRTARRARPSDALQPRPAARQRQRR